MAHRAEGLNDIYEHDVLIRETCTAKKFVGDTSTPTQDGNLVNKKYVDDAISGGGGSQTPWTSNIDGAKYDLKNVGAIETETINGDGNLIVTGNYAGTYYYVGTFNNKPYWTYSGGWIIHWDATNNLWVQHDTLANGANLAVIAASDTLTGNWDDGYVGEATTVDYVWTIDDLGNANFNDIEKLASRTTDGFVKFTNTDGTIGVDTNTYLTSISGLDISDLNNDSGFISDLSGFTTDDLSEGSFNLYYADGLVDTWLSNKGGYTGDLNDSTGTKIADVVGGLITGVYF